MAVKESCYKETWAAAAAVANLKSSAVIGKFLNRRTENIESRVLSLDVCLFVCVSPQLAWKVPKCSGMM